MVVLRASTGAILAMASQGAADLAYHAERAPGSTSKVVTAEDLLRNGLTPDSAAPCPAKDPAGSQHFLHTVRMDSIGGFTIERTLGHGGMGPVHLGRSLDGRAVAIKTARPELAGDPAFRARLIEGVSAARAVSGLHVAQVVDADLEGDSPWVATAYVPGPTLTQLLFANGPMSEPDLRRLGAGVSEALSAIHACGLVHGDLKPGNVILAENGPRVVDFGVAHAVAATRLTYLGTAAGTAGFLAPEQVTGTEVTPAADVFAFGAVLATASGREPFGGGGPLSVLYRTVNEEPDLSTLPASLGPVVVSCLAKDPVLRPSPLQLLAFFAGPSGDAMPVPTAAAVPAPAPVPVPVPDPGAQDQAFVGVDAGGAVSIDGTGVFLQRPGAELELGWDQIAHITYALSPRGHRILVSVFCTNGYQAHQEIDARRQSERLRLVGELETALYLYAGGRHMAG